jgi:uncharacterized membrane protein
MTVIFWLAMALCGIVGLLAFVAPEFATRQVLFCLAKWKSSQFKGAKVNQLKLFALISQLHAGKRDRYIFLTMSAQVAAVMAIVGAGIAVLVFVLLERNDALKKLIPLNISFVQSLIIAFIEFIISLATFAFLATFSIRFFNGCCRSDASCPIMRNTGGT